MKKAAALPYKTILAINTTDRDQIDLAWLSDGSSPITKSFPSRAQALPELIDGFLADLGQQVANVKAVGVMRTPGSLTGARMGIAVANTLAWLGNIPVIELDGTEFASELATITAKHSLRVVKQTRPVS